LLFNSYPFIFLFLPISFFVYFYLLRKRLKIAARAFLVAASLFFYSWWNVIYLPIILFSMFFNYAVGSALGGKGKAILFHRKTLLFFGILANLSLLGYFKYSDFFISNVNLLFGASIPLLHLALPLAISFFTFQQIAYLVDSYRGETKEYDFLNYALFVTFFPQLIAGPIVHHSEMMPQFASRWNLVKNYKHIAAGLFIFSIGLFKKVVIADGFAVWATAGFDTAPFLTLIEAWATSLSYTFQLYFDFSGYTDMAIGAALLFNIKLPINFNSPYKACDIQDFWRRWHITLSRFLKDYVYIPLGGNRKGEGRTYANLLATFLIGGIWHGAGWTFVFWGLLHGLALMLHRFWKSLGFTMPALLAWFITFNFINFTWIFFRAREWKDAMKVFKGMLGKSGVVLPEQLQDYLSSLAPSEFFSFGRVTFHIMGGTTMMVWLLVAFVLVLRCKNSNEKIAYPRLDDTGILIHRNAVWYAFLFMFSLLYMSISTYSEFIYFNF